MAAKVDQSSSVEPRHVQSPVSTPSAISPKVSIFGAKAGFVIPKNKLSGSLVIRGSGKNETGRNLKEENTKQVQRKTKWGPDLTQDPAVRKARALAYQTRVEQITKQLKSGALETGENDGSLSPAKASNCDDAGNQTEKESKKLELLELERREIIGEILHLNPGYKAPADYRPLLKETKVPIPTKAHPAYNIIGLLLGPESNTQKRLQEETGAKIQVYGTKKASGEKSEISQADINEAQDVYEDLYINVSADTYDKVDAAVALIELLLTPVSVNSAATSATTVVSSAVPSGDVDPAAVQLVQVTAQPGLLPYQPYHAPWFSTAQNNVPSIPSSGTVPNPLPNNSFQLQPPFGSFNMPPYTGQSPHVNLMPRTTLHVPGPQSSMPTMQQPPPPYPANPSTGPPFGSSQGIQASGVPAYRPPLAVSPQPMPISPTGPLPSRPLQTPPTSGGWPTFSPVAAQSQRPQQTTPTFMPVRPPISVSPVSATPRLQLAISSVPSQSNISASFGGQPLPGANFTPPAAFSSRPSAGPQAFPSFPPQGPSSIPALASSPAGASSQAPHPPLPSMQGHHPMSMPAPMRGPPSPFPQAGTTPGMPGPVLPQASTSHPMRPVQHHPSSPVSSAPVQIPALAQPTVPSSQPPPAFGVYSSGSMPGFSLSVPTSTSSTLTSAAAPRPPLPVSGDFTFQPLRSPAPTPNLPQPATQVGIHANIPLGVPQAPSFRPANQSPGVPVQGLQRPPDVNQMCQPRMPVLPPHLSGPFPRNPAVLQPPAGVLAFSPNHMRSAVPTVQVGAPSFSSMPPSNPSNSLPTQPVQFLPPQQNLFTNMNRPPSLVTHNGPFGEIPHNGNQIYDPFAPTAVSVAPRRQPADASAGKKSDTDPEYEDLMASVGMK